MLYRLKNDGGIELHLEAIERDMLYNALKDYYSIICCKHPFTEDILKILNLYESIQTAKELNLTIENLTNQIHKLNYEIEILKKEKKSACKMAEDYYSDIQDLIRGKENENDKENN